MYKAATSLKLSASLDPSITKALQSTSVMLPPVYKDQLLTGPLVAVIDSFHYTLNLNDSVVMPFILCLLSSHHTASKQILMIKLITSSPPH